MHSADYQSAFDAGRKRAANWFAQHGHTLAVYRDQQRTAYITSLQDAPEAGYSDSCIDFDSGFAAGLADLIAGVNHG